MDKTVQSIENQLKYNCGNCPWDISGAELRRKTRKTLHLVDFIKEGKEWDADDIAPYAELIRHNASRVKTTLNVTINDRMSDIQVIHQLLSQMGLRTQFRWKTQKGVKQRIYSINQEYWKVMKAVLERRLQHRLERQAQDGSPPHKREHIQGGDPILQNTANFTHTNDLGSFYKPASDAETIQTSQQFQELLQSEIDAEVIVDITASIFPYEVVS